MIEESSLYVIFYFNFKMKFKFRLIIPNEIFIHTVNSMCVTFEIATLRV